MSRLIVFAFLAWSVTLSVGGYKFGAHVQSIEDQAAQAKGRDAEVAQAEVKQKKALAAGVRTEQAQAKTDVFFQTLRADYETDKTIYPITGCVLDPVSLRRWNAANAQSDDGAPGEPADGVPDEPSSIEDGPGRGGQPHRDDASVSHVPESEPRLDRLVQNDGGRAMTDVYDRATEREEIARQDAVDEQRRRAGLEGKTIDDSAVECAVCEQAIPELRRQALPGVQTCVECQAELERVAHANAGGNP